MFSNNFLKFTLFASVLFALDVLQQAESSVLKYYHHGANSQQYPIVYERFIRPRPPMHPHDEYSEDVMEIFHTKEKPPSNSETAMTDEEVDKFIFCDFNRHLDECKKYWKSRERPTIRRTTTTTTTTKKPLIVTSTTLKSTTSTSEPEPTTTEFSKIPHLDYNYYEEKEDLDAEEEKEYNEDLE